MIPLEPIPDQDPLTATEAAAALGMPHSTVQKWLNAGKIPGAFRTPAVDGYGHWRIPRAVLVDLAAELGVTRL